MDGGLPQQQHCGLIFEQAHPATTGVEHTRLGNSLRGIHLPAAD
jgi:hypothetical protein